MSKVDHNRRDALAAVWDHWYARRFYQEKRSILSCNETWRLHYHWRKRVKLRVDGLWTGVLWKGDCRSVSKSNDKFGYWGIAVCRHQRRGGVRGDFIKAVLRRSAGEGDDCSSRWVSYGGSWRRSGCYCWISGSCARQVKSNYETASNHSSYDNPENHPACIFRQSLHATFPCLWWRLRTGDIWHLSTANWILDDHRLFWSLEHFSYSILS